MLIDLSWTPRTWGIDCKQDVRERQINECVGEMTQRRYQGGNSNAATNLNGKKCPIGFIAKPDTNRRACVERCTILITLYRYIEIEVILLIFVVYFKGYEMCQWYERWQTWTWNVNRQPTANLNFYLYLSVYTFRVKFNMTRTLFISWLNLFLS